MRSSESHMELVSRYLSGQATATEVEALEQAMLNDPQLRADFLACARVDAALPHFVVRQPPTEQGYDFLPSAVPSEIGTKIGPSNTRWNYSKSGLAIAALLAVSLFISTILHLDSGAKIAPPTAAKGVAVLSRALNVQWKSASRTFQQGDLLQESRIELSAGLVEIEFFSGASIILEGPAELELVHEKHAICHQGSLRAFVPDPAEGFTISAPGFDAVDLGTEFAMSVDQSGESEIHVLDGSVDVHAKSGDLLRSLRAGDAARQRVNVATLEEMPAEGERFVDRQQLLQMTGEHSESRYQQWRRFRKTWTEDGDTLLYFDFEDHARWDRELRNARTGQPNGGIVGARWVAGRWPEKSALEFKRPSDRVRLNVPGQWDAISFAAWIRVEGLDRRHNALFLADEWNAGEPHWLIGAAGQLSLAVNSVGRAKTAPLLGPSSLGQWIHVAVTCDPLAKEIHHYVNGRLVASGETNHTNPITIGGAEIGNWKPHQKASGPSELRSFNGRLDELLLLGRILDPEEVEELFDVGNPYR